MKRIHFSTPLRVVATSSLAASLALLPVAGSVFAVDGTTSPTTTTTTTQTKDQTTSTTLTDTQKARLQLIISKGDAEITRRLTSLKTLTDRINGAIKLTAADKTALTNEVNSAITGLTALKTQLDSETTLTGAKTDVENIYSQYRVYALLGPKIGLIRTADDQQAVEAKLQTLAGKLQTRITTAKQAGKDVTALQTQLDDLTAKITASLAISSKVESTVITLEPTDYNSDHTVLSGYNDQLKTARTDNQAAMADAKAIVAGLKTLS
ncbi:MAG TPA: hypothetical protein VN081_05860 [Dongiaceae bacterium]|nr:hypothetical protein [Dongiaceae bacterium]